MACNIFLLKSLEIIVSNKYWNYYISETGEQLAVGVTILLSLVVFFLMVETRVPNTSDHLPLLSKYYCCTVIEISAVLAVTCIIHKFEHRGAVPLPSWVKVCFLLCIIGYIACFIRKYNNTLFCRVVFFN